METFSKVRGFIEHPDYVRARLKVLSEIKLENIDDPIRDIVITFGKLPQCFTLQCCYGHFVWKGQPGIHNLALPPLLDEGPVRYRIAYLAFCMENSTRGTILRDRFAAICDIDEEYIQFGSPAWFWRQYPNSYALQVEPLRFAMRDEAMLEHAEALHVQSVRDLFFLRVREVLTENIEML